MSPLKKALLASLSLLTALVLLSFIFWQFIEKQAERNARKVIDTIVFQSTLRLETELNTRLAAMQLLVRQFQKKMIDSKQVFEKESSLLQEQFGGFQAVNFVNRNGIIQWVVPLKGNEPARGQKLFKHPVAGPHIKNTLLTRQEEATAPLDLYQGGRGFTCYHPVFKNDSHIGFINSVFRIKVIIEHAWGSSLLNDFELSIYDKDSLVFKTADFDEVSKEYKANKKLRFLNRTWLIKAQAKPGYWQQVQSDHTWFLFSSLAMSLLVTSIFYFYRINRQRLEAEKEEILNKAGSLERFQALGRFASSIAHDFKNYLSAISAYAELLGRQKDENKKKEIITRIVTATRNAADLTNRLLTFSRTREGELKTMHIETEVKKTIEIINSLAPSHVQVEFEPEGINPMVQIDPVALEQSLVNMALNAFDAMPNGGFLKIKIKTDIEKVYLEISDTGMGMSADIKSRIFEPFFTTKTDGNGIGLATSLDSITRMNGQLNVTSQPEKGTTFLITLPRNQS